MSLPQILSERTFEEDNKLLLDMELRTAPKTTEQVVKAVNKNKFKVPGFRPGKVPKAVMERAIGKDQLYERALSDSYKLVREQKGFTTASDPDLVEWKEESDGSLVFKVKVEILKDFDVNEADFIGLEVEKDDVDEGKALFDYETYLTGLEKQMGTYKPQERPAQIGDRIVLNLDIHLDGKKFEEISLKGTQIPLEESVLTPEIANVVAGTLVNEQKTVEVTFPADYQNPSLREKTATLTYSLDSIKELTRHPRNDDLAKQTNSGVATLDELKEKYLAEHRQNQERSINQIFEFSCMEALMQKIKLDIPQSMVTNEAQGMLRYRFEMFKNMGLSGEKAFEGLDYALLNEQAKRRLAAALIFEKLVKKDVFKLADISEADMAAHITKKAEDMNQKFDDLWKKYEAPEKKELLKKELLYDKFVRTVVTNAKPVPKITITENAVTESQGDSPESAV